MQRRGPGASAGDCPGTPGLSGRLEDCVRRLRWLDIVRELIEGMH